MRPQRLVPIAILVLAGLLATAACSSAPAPAPAAPRPASAPAAPPAEAPASSGATASNKAAEQIAPDRMVIRNAYIQLVVEDVNQVLERVAGLAQDLGGYVLSSESQEQGDSRVGKASIRVPSDRMDEALKTLRGLAVRTGRENSTAKDVTEEFVDQEARLRALRATEEQYLQLMRTARTTDDIIKVQQSLTQIREQIERSEGRINYLRRSTEMAVISMDITTSGAARPLAGGEWNPADQATLAFRALLGMASAAASVAIWVVIFAPVWLPFLLLLRWWTRRQGTHYPPAPRATPPAPPAPPPAGAWAVPSESYCHDL